MKRIESVEELKDGDVIQIQQKWLPEPSTCLVFRRGSTIRIIESQLKDYECYEITDTCVNILKVFFHKHNKCHDTRLYKILHGPLLTEGHISGYNKLAYKAEKSLAFKKAEKGFTGPGKANTRVQPKKSTSGLSSINKRRL